jgi:arylsulfatase A-like enzyme
MKRNPSGTLLVVVLVGGALALAIGLRSRPAGGTDPVVIITIDTMRWDRAGFNGNKDGLTPHLDALAAEGAVFEDAASAGPRTLPSHATILTGLLPPRHGLRDNDSPRPLPPGDLRDFLTAAEIFRQPGYATAAFVSASPLAPRWGLDAGFETYDAPAEGAPGDLHLGERAGGETVDRAIQWLRTRNKRRPFLLWVHLFDPHHPYRAPEGAGHPPDSPKAYDEEVKYADAQVGRLVDALRSEDLLRRAVIAVCADHGEGLGEHGESTHGYFLHRSTLRVPFLLRAPGRVGPGSRVKTPVSLADLLPTVLEAAGRPLPDRLLDGRSRLPLLQGGEANPAGPSDQYAETVYGWRTFRWAQAVSLRTGPYKVVDFGGDRRAVHDLSKDPGEGADLGAGAPPAASEAAAAAWALFGSPPRLRSADRGTNPSPDPALLALPYVSGYSAVSISGPKENGRLPLPSTGFLQDFEKALRLLERARVQEVAVEGAEEMEEALRLLKDLATKDPKNPAPPFWIGRALRQKAKTSGADAPMPWYEAFFHFRQAGILGYREPRTVSLMLEAAFQARKYKDMLDVARDASEGERMDGDASFWGWVSLAWWLGARDAAGNPTTECRARAQEAVAKARARARGPAEEERIREIEAILR